MVGRGMGALGGVGGWERPGGFVIDPLVASSYTQLRQEQKVVAVVGVCRP